MMAINLIYYLNQKYNNKVEFFCDASDYHLNRLILETGIDKINFFNYLSFAGQSKSKIIKVLNVISEVFLSKKDKFTKFDQLIVLGGDDFSEYYNINFYSSLYKVLLIKNLNLISKKIPVILYGQTIGPYSSWRKFLVSRFFKTMSVVTRDKINYDHLNTNYQFKRCDESRDLALLDLPKQKNRSSILTSYDLESDNYICIVISGLYYQYCNSKEKYIKNWNNIISLISNKFFNYKIVLLTHVHTKNYSDSLIIDKIENSNNILKITNKMLPSEAREILGNAYFTITGRMHAAVSSFQMGKPAISLSYGVKYKGVVGDGLNMSDLLIEKDNILWDNFLIASVLNEKIDFLIDNYFKISKEIPQSVNDCQEIINKSLDKLILNKDKE
tara:strand:- start:3708 stop:4865 length:1158 start_codon:yes stop_codon:yes gene_type:complete